MPKLKIVLVATSHPGNIGAAARAMKTMGLTNLCLVEPRMFPHTDATAMAAGADDILDSASVCSSLDDALVGCHLVFGASARGRYLSWPEVNPRQAAQNIVGRPVDEEVALVFGRERTGLTNEELERCHSLIRIPANPDYASLNLAAAVQVVAYELRMADLESKANQSDTVEQSAAPLIERRVNRKLAATAAAPAEQMAQFYQHLEQVVIELGFLDPKKPRQLMRRLRRLYQRAQPDQNEINILRGILSATQSAKSRRPINRETTDKKTDH